MCTVYNNEAMSHYSTAAGGNKTCVCVCVSVCLCVSAHAVANDREWMTDSGGNVYSVKSFDLELIGSEQQDAQQKVN